MRGIHIHIGNLTFFVQICAPRALFYVNLEKDLTTKEVILKLLQEINSAKAVGIDNIGTAVYVTL